MQIGYKNLEHILRTLVEASVDTGVATGAGASNTDTRITVTPAWTTVPDATSTYRVGFYGKMSGDITAWGGTAVTGRDISQDLARLDIALSTLRDDLQAMFSPQSVYNSSTAAALAVELDTGLYGGRTTVEVWVKSSAAADFEVYGSRDGSNWRLVDTISLAGADEDHRGYQNAYRYIRVTTAAANDNEIEIVASR